MTAGLRFTQSLQRNAAVQPDSVAVSDQLGSVTYAELRQRVAKLAGALQALGVRKNDRVAMLSLNSRRYIEYAFAVPWLGAVINPVNFRWNAKEIAYSLVDSDARVLLIDRQFLPVLDEIREMTPCLEHIILAESDSAPDAILEYEGLLNDAAPIEDSRRGDSDLLGIFYTGGTTGFPKGVMISHANAVVGSVNALALGMFPSGCRYLHAAPMFHMADFFTIGCVSMGGGTHVVIPAFTPQGVQQVVEGAEVTDVLLVPTMIQMLLDSPDLNTDALASIRRIVYGASPMPYPLLEKAIEAMPGVEFFQAYGMTELTALCCLNGPENHTAKAKENGRIRSAGRPSPIHEVRIVDESNREKSQGEVGEICVRGPTTMLGYWNNPEETANALRDGWMHTGDAGYMDDAGFVYVVDRVKDMIISGGENIYSAEVETAVLQHVAVSQCAVIGVPSQEWGEEVRVYTVLETGASLTIEELYEYCRERIASYKCPKSMVTLDALPLSAAGKVAKNELRERSESDSAQVR